MFKYSWLQDFIDVIYPNACMGCHLPLVAHEELICTHCLHEIPRTDFHHDTDNPVVRTFNGRCMLTKATSFLHFVKGGRVQSLMHHFKYRGRQEVGTMLTELAIQDLRKTSFLDDIDIIIPIPLHPSKLKKRGYNQSEIIGRCISRHTHQELMTENLIRCAHSETQTRKSRFARWLNVEAIFKLENAECLRDKHILLVDDVLTTGSTIEACILKMEAIPGIRISLFTLAIAQ